MLKMPVEEIANKSKLSVHRTAVLAKLPNLSDLELRRAAMSAVRRPPVLPRPARKKGAVPGELSPKDSALYSAEDIKAALRVDSQASKARMRTMKYNSYLPVGILSYSVIVCLFLAISFTTLQFAGLAELRFHVDVKQRQLEALQHDRDELTAELSLMNSLQSLQKQAKNLQMIYPNNIQKIDLPSPAKLSMDSTIK